MSIPNQDNPTELMIFLTEISSKTSEVEIKQDKSVNLFPPFKIKIIEIILPVETPKTNSIVPTKKEHSVQTTIREDDYFFLFEDE